ncbi:MAG: hypothetical protein EON60_03050 [Alphaproteobacteria bacterium]|nr:MAG: hypothetical protein EON60_03050 [Alphaproteobacteria bacterium]
MIRSTYRNLMLLLLLLSFGVSFYLFRKTQDVQLEIGSFQNDIIRLRQELENAQSLNVALNELDNLTITEQTATQLDILRHLGLEQSNLNFTVESRDEQVIGDTRLFIHNVRIGGNMPYETALNLSDKLQSTKKIVLDAIELTVLPSDPNNFIMFSLAGKIYGLEKNLEALAQAAAANPEDQIVPTPEIPTQPLEDAASNGMDVISPTDALPVVSPTVASPNQETAQ